MKHCFLKNWKEPFTTILLIKQAAIPQFFKLQPVPFVIKDAISQELDQLEKQGIIFKVPYSQWATQIVPVLKRKTGICGD